MTPIFDQSRKKRAGGFRSTAAFAVEAKALMLYDKDARSVAGALTTDFAPIYESLLQSEVPGIADYTLVQAVVGRRESNYLLIGDMLQQNVVMALGSKGGILVHRQGNGSLALYCIVLQLTDRIKVTGIEADAEEGIRRFLKECYAGWHHIFHEVLAMATDFATAPVCGTTIEELVSLIQVPAQFPA